MRFPPHFLDAIRERIPIAEVVGRRVAWDKRKSNPGRGDYWACCPFHGEKTPSFHADNRKGRYHCFGCGASGDHFTFLVEAEGLRFPEAVAQLAELAGLPMPPQDAGAEKREEARASLFDVLEKAALFYQAALQQREGGRARAYLRERGLGPELQQRFRIGYAPASRSALKEHLASAGIGQDQMIEAGLLVAGPDIPVSFDRFRDRVMFPIADLRGRVIAFGGRALSADAQAKYLNSPETPLFHKGEVLYNGQAARIASRRSGQVIAVEGYVDVIACVSAGFEAAVAPLGTALTEDQLRRLWQMAEEPVLCFDGDGAGLKAAFRAIDTALPHLGPGRSLRFALLPDGQDPDDLIRSEGAAAFRQAIDTARPLVDMLWDRAVYGQTLDTPERRAGVERALKDAVAKIGDSDVRRHYETAVREKAAAAFGSVRAPAYPRMARDARNARTVRQAPEGPSASLLSHRMVKRANGRAAGPNIGEAVLIGGLLCHPEIAADRLETLARQRFGSRALDALSAALSAALGEAPDAGFGTLRQRLELEGHGAAIAAVLEKLRESGLNAVGPAGDAARAARIWDDAAHLRQRAASLSIERQAAAMALARETSDFHLERLRDIQEQDLRNLHPDGQDDPEEYGVPHPFKRP
ncbi:DNA primase [Faunimonas sp. B44]|uniref:DNA primase n=1 Tax=Faunimonas sp. B44 TaxID=3461493 RepID=UPI004044D8A8